MIFVCTGSRNYQFDRLIKEIDRLVTSGQITEEVFAQIGESTYLPSSYKYVRYLNAEEFVKYQENARLIITHGGTGAIVGALKKGKYVIGVPRLAQYGEHIDDHQLQIVQSFVDEGYIRGVYDINELMKAIKHYDCNPEIHRYNNESKIIDIIDIFLQKELWKSKK